MSCKILVSNKSTLAKAEIVEICDYDRVFSVNESMQVFIANGGGFENWSRKFSIVTVTDKTKEELSYLSDCQASNEYIKNWLFLEPPTTTAEWNDLYLTGEVTRDWSIVSKYIIERT